MAWGFETDPEFQQKLDWVAEFVKREVEPLDQLLDSAYDLTVLAEARGLFRNPGFAQRYAQLKLDVLDLVALYNRLPQPQNGAAGSARTCRC